VLRFLFGMKRKSKPAAVQPGEAALSGNSGHIAER